MEGVKLPMESVLANRFISAINSINLNKLNKKSSKAEWYQRTLLLYSIFYLSHNDNLDIYQFVVSGVSEEFNPIVTKSEYFPEQISLRKSDAKYKIAEALRDRKETNLTEELKEKIQKDIEQFINRFIEILETRKQSNQKKANN